MADVAGRFVFPDDRMTYLLNKHSSGTGLFSAQGQKLLLFTDAAGAHAATDLVNYDSQEPFSTAFVVVDENSQIPMFYGPVGATELYVRGVGDTQLYPIFASSVQRITTLETVTRQIDSQTFTYMGTLQTRIGKSRWYLANQLVWDSAYVGVSTAPTGQSVILDVKKNGTTIFSNQANRPTIAAGSYSQMVQAPDVTTFGPGDYLTVDIAQIGNPGSGADVSLTIRLVKTG